MWGVGVIPLKRRVTGVTGVAIESNPLNYKDKIIVTPARGLLCV